MALKDRVERLEAVNGAATGPCTCQGPRVVWGDDGTGTLRPDPGPEVCPDCGRKRVTLRVEYGSLAKSIAEAVAKGAGPDETYNGRALRTLGELLADRTETEAETQKGERDR